MAVTDIADQYFTYEERLASFKTAQQLSKRRASNASSKAPKSIKWPHKFMVPEQLAKAGFFYYPAQTNPDNVACFLCHKNFDGWEEEDDPLAEHIKHSPDCGWAIVASIEKQDGDFIEEYPSSLRMIEARKATFADKWPHEGKKGWKCKVKQLVDAGWKYTPTPESDDMATCAYCALGLDGWEPTDKPLDEHFNRSPDCAFFTLVNNYKQSPAMKRTKGKRASKFSQLSTQSAFTVASDAQSVTDLPAEEGDSILTTATNATATQGGKRMTKPKKAQAAKGRKTKTKKAEPEEVVPGPEPEDDDFEVKVEVASKPTRGRKRKSEQENDASVMDVSAPPTKRRVTRTRGSIAANDSIIDLADVINQDLPQPKGRKGRTSRKVSAVSVSSSKAQLPDDDEIDAALEADLDKRMTDDEARAVEPLPPPKKKATRVSKVAKSDHAMFGIEPIETDEAAIEAELVAMEAESKPLPKAKGAKGKQSRKASAKQQAAAKKAAEEAEAEAERLAEEEASQQIAAELEHSISIQHSSPITQPKKQRASSRQPSRQLPSRPTRGSVLSVNDQSHDQNHDSGNETDASMASQATVVRGGSNRRGSTLKKGKGKKNTGRNIEEIVHKPVEAAPDIEPTVAPTSTKGKIGLHVEDISMTEERFYTPAPEAPPPVAEEPVEDKSKGKAAKPRGRLPKTAPAQRSVPEVAEDTIESSHSKTKSGKGKTIIQPLRSPTLPPRERTPSQSPQSSDAENHPPSSKPSATMKKTTTPRSTAKRLPLSATTPSISPSKRNIIAGLQSSQPWISVDLDNLFTKTPSGTKVVANAQELLGDDMGGLAGGALTSPEKRMTVEEWIHHNAEIAEEKLRNDCERMVSSFESKGTKAMMALEGIECLE